MKIGGIDLLVDSLMDKSIESEAKFQLADIIGNISLDGNSPHAF